MPDSAAVIRAWAQQHGHDVADRGRLSAEVREAYAQATQTSKSAKTASAPSTPKATAREATKPRTAPTKASTVVRSRQAGAAKLPLATLEPVTATVVGQTPAGALVDLLAHRVTALEQQITHLLTRLAALEQPKRWRRSRRSR